IVRRPAEVELAFDAELGTGGGCLPAIVRLHARAPNDDIRAAADGIGHEKLVVPCLVAAEQHAGAVVALDENPHVANLLGEAWHFLQGRRQMSEIQPRQPGNATLQLLRRENRERHAEGLSNAAVGLPESNHAGNAASRSLRLGIAASSTSSMRSASTNSISRRTWSGISSRAFSFS